MANPNRCMAAEQRRVRQTAYWTFPTVGTASKFAEYLKVQGFSVKETRFRIGPRDRYAFNDCRY